MVSDPPEASDRGPEAFASTIAQLVRARGGRALIVGGWVRDRLLGRQSKDIDLEVYGIPERNLRVLLQEVGRVEAVGESFRVYKVTPFSDGAATRVAEQPKAERGTRKVEPAEGRGSGSQAEWGEGLRTKRVPGIGTPAASVDVALPRRESKRGRGHRGFEVHGDPLMSLEEAARRRDFTINAIAWDPLADQYLDPYGGRQDLARGVLRTVDPVTFADDSLRVLRALQFAARFDFSVDDETKALCRGVALDDLPAERIWGEFEKLLLASRPSTGFRLALELGVIEQLCPEMLALVGCQQEPEWHPEGDVWVHTLMVIDEARRRIDDLDRPRKLTIMLGACCHDFGKPSTTAWVEGRIRSHNHEEAGVEPTLAFLDRLNVHTLDGYDVRRQVVALVAHHLKPGMWHKVRHEIGDSAFRRLAQKVDLELLARLASADCVGRTGPFDCSAMEWFLERARTLGVEHRPPAPLLLGRHLLALGVPPGPRVGIVLKQVYERQLDGEVTTDAEALALARTILQRVR